MGKYLKLFETSNDYETFKDSDEWITPNVSLIGATPKEYVVKYKVKEEKRINYITYHYDGTYLIIQATYPVTSNIYIYNLNTGVISINVGESSTKKIIPPGGKDEDYKIKGIGFNGTDVHNGAQTLEDNTYIYQVKHTINFTVKGTTYQAEEGMTWDEWIDSEYNINGFIKSNSNSAVYDSAGNQIGKYTYAMSTINEIIVAGHNYVYYDSSASGGRE
jgi:hypothetical protein